MKFSRRIQAFGNFYRILTFEDVILTCSNLVLHIFVGLRVLGTRIITGVEEGHWRIYRGSWERFIIGSK